MTRAQYEEAIKAIMETATELMKKAVSDTERLHIMMTQNLQIQGIVEEYERSNN